jgi:1-acyl-sn-glycerol-3-phosphate acyltransferase
VAEKIKLKDSIFKRLWYLLCRIVSVGTVTILYRLKIYGTENIPKTGPTLILSNHQSFFDTMFCQNWVRRPFYFVPRDTLLDIKFWGWVIRSLYTIPIKRGQADIAAMRTIIDALKQDKAVCLFPEGTRTLDGRIGKIKPGFGLISRRSNATIVPMVIDGVFEAWPKGQKWPKLGKVAVLYGKSFTPEYIAARSDEEFAAEITQMMRTLQAELRTRMGKTPYDYPQENST